MWKIIIPSHRQVYLFLTPVASVAVIWQFELFPPAPHLKGTAGLGCCSHLCLHMVQIQVLCKMKLIGILPFPDPVATPVCGFRDLLSEEV